MSATTDRVALQKPTTMGRPKEVAGGLNSRVSFLVPSGGVGLDRNRKLTAAIRISTHNFDDEFDLENATSTKKAQQPSEDAAFPLEEGSHVKDTQRVDVEVAATTRLLAPRSGSRENRRTFSKDRKPSDQVNNARQSILLNIQSSGGSNPRKESSEVLDRNQHSVRQRGKEEEEAEHAVPTVENPEEGILSALGDFKRPVLQKSVEARATFSCPRCGKTGFSSAKEQGVHAIGCGGDATNPIITPIREEPSSDSTRATPASEKPHPIFASESKERNVEESNTVQLDTSVLSESVGEQKNAQLREATPSTQNIVAVSAPLSLLPKNYDAAVGPAMETLSSQNLNPNIPFTKDPIAGTPSKELSLEETPHATMTDGERTSHEQGQPLVSNAPSTSSAFPSVAATTDDGTNTTGSLTTSPEKKMDELKESIRLWTINFIKTHNRPPNARDKLEIDTLYQQYKALESGSTSSKEKVEPKREASEKKKKEEEREAFEKPKEEERVDTAVGGESSGVISHPYTNTASSAVVQEQTEKAKMTQERELLRQKIKDWTTNFIQTNGRPPTNEEKISIKELYVKYKKVDDALRLLSGVAERAPQNAAQIVETPQSRPQPVTQTPVKITYPQQTEQTQSLIVCITENNLDALIQLLNAATGIAQLHTADQNGTQPFHYASTLGSIAILQILIKYGADVMACDTSGKSSLFYAVSARQFNSCALILSVAPEEVYRHDHKGDTPLHLAVSEGDVQIASLLIDAGADPNAVNVKDQSSAHCCLDVTCLSLVFDRGADLFRVDKIGRTTLFLACAKGSVDIVAFLCDVDTTGELLEWPDYRGDTPLHAAACNGHSLCVEFLLQNGAKTLKVNNYSLTAKAIAQLNNHSDCVQLLDEYESFYIDSIKSPQRKLVATQMAAQKLTDTTAYTLLRHTSSVPSGLNLNAAISEVHAVGSRKASISNVWESVLDNATGQTYYYNRVTNESSWTIPSESVEEEPARSSPVDSSEQTVLERNKLSYLAQQLHLNKDYAAIASEYDYQRPYRQYDSSITCSICYNNIVQDVFLPCEHKCVCPSCLVTYNIGPRQKANSTTDSSVPRWVYCPVCNQVIIKVVQTAPQVVEGSKPKLSQAFIEHIQGPVKERLQAFTKSRG